MSVLYFSTEKSPIRMTVLDVEALAGPSLSG